MTSTTSRSVGGIDPVGVDELAPVSSGGAGPASGSAERTGTTLDAGISVVAAAARLVPDDLVERRVAFSLSGSVCTVWSGGGAVGSASPAPAGAAGSAAGAGSSGPDAGAATLAAAGRLTDGGLAGLGRGSLLADSRQPSSLASLFRAASSPVARSISHSAVWRRPRSGKVKVTCHPPSGRW